MQAFSVDLQPIGRRAVVAADTTLLAAAQAAGVELQSICGGVGACSSCRVRLAEGKLTPLTLDEEAILGHREIAAGYRLACQAMPLSNVRLDIPAESLTAPQRLQVEGQGADVELDPIVIPIDIRIDPPTLTDLRGDLARLRAALPQPDAELAVGLPVLVDLPHRLRALNWNVRLAVRGRAPQREAVAILPRASRLYGLAIDIGTTKLAAYLVDLATGLTVAKIGAMNPQIAYGEDVISRIAYANQNDGRALQAGLVETLNRMAGEACAELDASRDQIVEAVAVGNTAMHHLFAGLPVRQLGESPYVPAVDEALDIPAAEVSLEIAPGARVYLPPNIAGYVGADHVAMLLAADLRRTAPDRHVLALDIGTNTEISLASGGRLLCCSCASGPAFEGAHIRDGMRAAPGAIERVRRVDGEFRMRTIGGLPPVGLCGSGVLDAVAEMLGAQLLDRRGRMAGNDPRTRAGQAGREFVLVPEAETGHGRDIVVTRKDVNEIQLAKGAIRAGIDILLAEASLSAGSLDEVIVAGAFGTYLDVGSAVRIGMFPKLPADRFRQVGNAAGAGARQLLVSAAQRQAAAEIARRVEYIELTNQPAFTRRFVDAMCF
jgi:uncharacterized 2Fe-2S/4Fe-4S cluster protein (DUF4445 family)